jgi:predicted nucleic acid-binding protein
MSSRPTVADSSCLITLEAIGRLSLLEKVLGEVVIPNAVALEVGIPLPVWLLAQTVRNRSLVTSLRLQLGMGESEAIALSLELSAARLILDDKKARRVARHLGLTIVGTVAVVVRARLRGLIASTKEVLEEMKGVGFHMADALYQEALCQSHE